MKLAVIAACTAALSCAGAPVAQSYRGEGPTQRSAPEAPPPRVEEQEHQSELRAAELRAAELRAAKAEEDEARRRNEARAASSDTRAAALGALICQLGWARLSREELIERERKKEALAGVVDMAVLYDASEQIVRIDERRSALRRRRDEAGLAKIQCDSESMRDLGKCVAVSWDQAARALDVRTQACGAEDADRLALLFQLRAR